MNKKINFLPGTLFVALACFSQACGSADQATITTPVSNDPRVVYEHKALSLLGGLLGTGSVLTLTTTILPPTGLYADSIYTRGTNAYVSYNVAGATTNGAIDLMDVTIPTVPVRKSTFTTNTSDINGVYVDSSSNVFAIGGDTNNGSLLYSLGVVASAFTAVSNTNYLPGYTGTAVKAWGSNLYTLTGNNGGLNILTPGSFANTSTPALSITDARGLDQSGSSNLWVVTGGVAPATAAKLLEVNAAGSILSTVNFTGANNIAESKSNVAVGASAVAVSLGSQGAAVVCMADHQVMGTVPAVTVTGVDPSLTVSNSVASGGGLLFVANGSAGVSVYSITNPLLTNLVGALIGTNTACGQIALTYQGQLDLGSASGYSANGVYYNNGTLYVATGSGGFKVITVDISVLGLVVGLVSSLL